MYKQVLIAAFVLVQSYQTTPAIPGSPQYGTETRDL